MGSLAVGIHVAEENVGDCVGAIAAGVPGFDDAATLSSQGMVTAVPVSSTTMV